jgi:hypothetical protein
MVVERWGYLLPPTIAVPGEPRLLCSSPDFGGVLGSESSSLVVFVFFSPPPLANSLPLFVKGGDDGNCLVSSVALDNRDD